MPAVLKNPAPKRTTPHAGAKRIARTASAPRVSAKPKAGVAARKTPPVSVLAPAVAGPGPMAARTSPRFTPADRPVPIPVAQKAPSDKPRKAKLVRDSFTIPKSEYLVLEELKQRGARLSSPVKKSELLRAGIKALAAMTDAALLDALRAVPAIKTGRPGKA